MNYRDILFVASGRQADRIYRGASLRRSPSSFFLQPSSIPSVEIPAGARWASLSASQKEARAAEFEALTGDDWPTPCGECVKRWAAAGVKDPMIRCGAPRSGNTASCAACFKDHKSNCGAVPPLARGDALVLRDLFAVPAGERDEVLLRAAQTAVGQAVKRATKRGGGDLAAAEREARERDVALAAMSRARAHWVEAQLAAVACLSLPKKEKEEEVLRLRAYLGAEPPKFETS
ncbi:hypothetical protein MY4824_002374 [Beauveria thailandica]